MLGLSKKELTVFKKLSDPIKIQNFIDQMPINWEKKGETYMSPRRALRENKAHCLEGALIAAAVLWHNGEKPLILDLKAEGDIDHVIALYKRNGYWGAISKTNHSTLRFRDPVYKTIRELALSYFHEYWNDKTGKKALKSYSKPFNLKRLGTKWITSEEDLGNIAEIMDNLPHKTIFPVKNKKFLRPADKMERRAGELVEWKKSDPHT